MCYYYRLDFGPDIPLTEIRDKGKRVPVSVADKPAMSRLNGDIIRGERRNRNIMKKKREAIFDQLWDSTKDLFCCKICHWKKSEDSDDKRFVFHYWMLLRSYPLIIARLFNLLGAVKVVII